MSANQILITQENANSEFAIKTVTPEAGKVMGFDSGLNPVMVEVDSSGGGTSTVFHSQTDLNINGANGNFFLVTLSANAGFTLSNIAVGVVYTFRIYNPSSNIVSITVPNVSDIAQTYVFDIPISKYREISMIYDGTNRNWQISGVLERQ